MTIFEVTQNAPDETVPLRTIDPGDAFAYNGALYLRLKYDPCTIVEIGRGSALANFECSNPPVTPVSRIEIIWVPGVAKTEAGK